MTVRVEECARTPLSDAGKLQPSGVRGRHLVPADRLSGGSATALADQCAVLNEDGDRLRFPITNERLQHARRQLPQLDGAGTDEPNACDELGGAGLATQGKPRYQRHEGVLCAGHGNPFSSKSSPPNGLYVSPCPEAAGARGHHSSRFSILG